MEQRILVLGATGNTGKEVVELALARGHRVTAFVRSPHKMTRTHERLSVTQGELTSAAALARALPGHDAVISALGPPTREAFRPSRLLAECAGTTVAAMTQAGVRRLAIVSAAPLFPEKGLKFRFFRWFLQHHLRDLEAMEAVVRATDFEWTIARPPRLVKSEDRTYDSAENALPARGRSMSFGAVATFLVDCIEQHRHLRTVVGLAGTAH
jgi:putative NADH-flavin reductase